MPTGCDNRFISNVQADVTFILKDALLRFFLQRRVSIHFKNKILLNRTSFCLNRMNSFHRCINTKFREIEHVPRLTNFPCSILLISIFQLLVPCVIQLQFQFPIPSTYTRHSQCRHFQLAFQHRGSLQDQQQKSR